MNLFFNKKYKYTLLNRNEYGDNMDIILLIGELSLSIHAFISICIFGIANDEYPEYKKFKSVNELYIILALVYSYSLFMLYWVNEYKNIEFNILEASIIFILSFIAIKPITILNEYVYKNDLLIVFEDSIFIRIVYPLSISIYASMYLVILIT